MTRTFTLLFLCAFIVSAAAGQSTGKIAYVRNSTEIRLINPDGSNDRMLWTDKALTPQLGIYDMAWKPDGTELVFSSAHEALTSPYMADLYGIRPDGTGLRRITNGPDRAGLAKFPKGSVTVKVWNDQPDATDAIDFVIYVEGSDEPQRLSIAPGETKVITFKSVADLGKRPQKIVAMFAQYRWSVPGVDVVAGKNVVAPLFPIHDQGVDLVGAFRPVWRADGSRIGFRDGLCINNTIAATPAPGAGAFAFGPIFAGKNPSGACAWEWGPTPALADQIIYTDNYPESNIFQMKEGGTHPGTKLTSFIDMPNQHVKDLHWMPDGSGVLYSTLNLYQDTANIFRYDIATKRTTPVTTLEKEFARAFSVSPDGRFVVFERCPTAEAEAGCNIWIVGTDGKGGRELVKNGLRPAWGK
jgi:hypothetical protein